MSQRPSQGQEQTPLLAQQEKSSYQDPETSDTRQPSAAQDEDTVPAPPRDVPNDPSHRRDVSWLSTLLAASFGSDAKLSSGTPRSSKGTPRSSNRKTSKNENRFSTFAGQGSYRRATGRRRRRHLLGRRVYKSPLFAAMYLGVLVYSLAIVLGPLYLHYYLRDRSAWCSVAQEANEEESVYKNPDYNDDPCYHTRVFPQLLGLTLMECDMSRRMLTSVVLGAMIGYERRSADRPAGIRTMGLVSLGACGFTICSILAFTSSTMGWDASRVTAALPSGVGFLGGALIWKGTVQVGDEKEEKQQVHGLTTAASLWLSAAIGVSSGGGLYVLAIYSTVLVLLMLRYGPTLYDHDDKRREDEPDEQDEPQQQERDQKETVVDFAEPESKEPDETDLLVHPSPTPDSLRRRRPSRRRSCPTTIPTFHN